VQGVCNFAPFLPVNWLPWQRPLRYCKKKVRLIIYHTISTIWCKDCQNRSSGSWDTSAPSERVRYKTKLATSLEILKKKFRSIIYTQKAFILCKKLQKSHAVCVLLTTQNWLPWQRPLRNWKNGPDEENSRKYLPFGEKIVKIGPVDTEIALLRVKKRELERVAKPSI